VTDDGAPVLPEADKSLIDHVYIGGGCRVFAAALALGVVLIVAAALQTIEKALGA
jgi:hypothetical protein